MKTITSPSPEVSKDAIEIEAATVTKIKEAIASGYDEKEIVKIIREGVNKMAKIDKRLALQMYRSLTKSARAWLYTYNINISNLNKSIVVQLTNLLTKEAKAPKLPPKENELFTSLVEELKKNPTKPVIPDKFRNFNTEIKAGIPVIKDYNEIVNSQLKLLASEVPKVEQIQNGKVKVLSLRNRVEMKTRYDANMKDLAQMKKNDVKLVWCSSHASCSPRCAKWQGKLFSLDGSSGSLDGVKYEPIENALNDNGGNSIINGYNCRHFLIEYTPKSQAPKTYSKQEMEKEYAIDKKQRLYEQSIRQLKAEKAVFSARGDNDQAKIYEKKINIKTLEYEAFSLENDRAFYRWRCDILPGEITTVDET